MPNPLGVLLRRFRAGRTKLFWSSEEAQAPQNFVLTSAAFLDGEPIPLAHTQVRGGRNLSPDLSWTPPPPGTVELVLLAEDPDVPLPRPLTHSLISGIDPGLGRLAEGALKAPTGDDSVRTDDVSHLRRGRVVGARGYSGPRPIASHGAHTYVFQMYALDQRSRLEDGFTRNDMRAALRGHVIGRARLDGTYVVR